MPVIKLRGLPWSCVEDEVVKFLNGVKIQQKVKNEESNSGQDGPCIYLTTNAEGRPSGEAFIELIDEDDVEQALKKNNALMGQRYIEVFRSNTEQLEKHLRESKSNASNWSDPVIRLRGLPYGCTINDIGGFFDGLKIASGGILMVIDFSGRFNGEAFVQFTNMGDAQRALEKHKQKIGNRYIEIFRSTFDEMQYYSANTNTIKNRQQKQTNKMGRFDNGDDYSNRNNRGKPYARNNQPYGGRQRGSISPSNDFSFNRNNNNNGNNEGPFSGGLPSLMSSLFNDSNNAAANSSFFNFNNSNGNGMGPAGVGGGNFDFNSFMSSSFFNNYAGNANLNNNNNNFNNNGVENYDNYQEDQYEEEYSLKMRGLPYSATEDDIRQFFEPLNPIQIDFIRNRDKRPSGEAEVFFDNQNDLNKAMKYDKKYMGSRYIELFLLSSGSSNGNGNSNGDGNGYGKNNNNGGGNFNPSVSNKTSLNSLMNQDFSNNLNNYGSLSRSSNGSAGSNIPPLLPMMPPMPSMVPPPPLTANNNPSVYSTNINEMLMADMAKKMFASAFGQYQNNNTANNNNQMFQPKGFSGSFNNKNGSGGGGSNNRRY